MTDLIRQEIDMGNGRTKIRFVTPQPRQPSMRNRSLAIPMMIRSFAEPVQSMADGKWYSNPSDLRRSYKAENNPAGVDYIELGNEEVTYTPEPEPTRGELKDEIRRAIHMVENEGWKPESVHIDDV